MTTIAWDGKTLAADSQSTEDAFVDPHEFNKIHDARDAIIAFAGDVPSGRAFMDWWNKGAERSDYPDFSDDDDMEALVFTEGKVLWYERRPFPEEIRAPWTIGTGSPFAMAAMLAGADAKKAVDIACRLDKYSGGKVVTRKMKGSTDAQEKKAARTAHRKGPNRGRKSTRSSVRKGNTS